MEKTMRFIAAIRNQGQTKICQTYHWFLKGMIFSPSSWLSQESQPHGIRVITVSDLHFDPFLNMSLKHGIFD